MNKLGLGIDEEELMVEEAAAGELTVVEGESEDASRMEEID